MRPDDGGVRVTLQQGFGLLEIESLRLWLGKWHMYVVMHYCDQTGLRCEVKNAIQRRVEKTGHITADLGRNKLLVDGKLADTGKYPGIGLQYPANVVRCVHIRGIETDDHRFKMGLLLLCQPLVLLGNVGVSKRVIIQRRIGIEIVGGCNVTGHPVRPLQLQWDAEQH